VSHITPVYKVTSLRSWFCLQVPDGTTNEKCLLWVDHKNISSVWMLKSEHCKDASNVSVATRCITQLELTFILETFRTHQFPPFLTFLIL
jgi:hypothetical protein